MTAAKDLAQRHYERFCGVGRISVSVPEWADEDGNALVVYWRPFTLRDHGVIFGAEPADARTYAKVLARKAEDAAGKKLFPEGEDLHVLLTQADGSVVRRLAEDIMRSPTVHEMADKLRRDGLRMAMHRLADRLGKTIDEIEAMPVGAFNETLAFHQVAAEKS